MSGWLDALLGRIFSSGVSIALSKGLNFTAGLAAELNTSTKVVDVFVKDGALTPSEMAVETLGAGIPFVIRIPMTAGAAGTADDVVGPQAPADLLIVDRWVDVTTAIGGSSVRARTAAGGVGASLTGIISSASVGEGLRANTGLASTQVTLDEGDTVYVRRSDRGVAGTLYLLCVKR